VRTIDADALKELFSEVIGHIAQKPEMNGNLEHMIRASAMVIQMIDDAPTVQPERTCVNCGRTANNGGWYADGRTRCPIEEHYALPKDGFCHLWEKRNVTDDDYPERMEE
jgi:hypothetical protein